MEISEDEPDFGLVSTRMVSVLKPVTSPASPMVPSRSSEPRISQLSPAVSALPVSQDCLLSCPSTQFHAENVDNPKERIMARKMIRMVLPTWRFPCGRTDFFATDCNADAPEPAMFCLEVPWSVIRGVLAGLEEEPRTCCTVRFGLCDAETGANEAGEDVAGLRVPLAERAAGRKLCGVPDAAADGAALERACCEAGEKLGIDWEPDFGGTGDL